MQPIGLIARGIGAQTNSLLTILHPLYMPLDYVDGWLLAHDHYIPGHFPLFKAAEDGKDYMERLANVVQNNALPFFQEYGTLEGFLKWCQQANAGIADGAGDPHILYRQAATAIVLRRDEEAAGALGAILSRAAEDFIPREWLQRLSQQAGMLRSQLAADPAAVRSALLAGAAEQRRRRRLPITDD